MSKGLWNQPAPVPPGQGTKGNTAVKDKETITALRELAAPAVAEVSHYRLVEKGWCAWQCDGLGGDTILVVVDESVTGYPKGYPVYTLQELQDILPLDAPLLQAAHRAKKELGARIGEEHQNVDVA